jgi:hypothetical protein
MKELTGRQAKRKQDARRKRYAKAKIKNKGQAEKLKAGEAGAYKWSKKGVANKKRTKSKSGYYAISPIKTETSKGLGKKKDLGEEVKDEYQKHVSSYDEKGKPQQKDSKRKQGSTKVSEGSTKLKPLRGGQDSKDGAANLKAFTGDSKDYTLETKRKSTKVGYGSKAPSRDKTVSKSKTTIRKFDAAKKKKVKGKWEVDTNDKMQGSSSMRKKLIKVVDKGDKVVVKKKTVRYGRRK